MALQGQAAQDVRAFARQAPPLDTLIRDELVAGWVANGIHVNVLNAVTLASPTFEQECRDLCDASLQQGAPSVRAKQNMFLKWQQERLGNGPVTNVPEYLAHTMAAMTAQGATAAQMSTAIANVLARQGTAGGGGAAPTPTDLGTPYYVVLLHMGLRLQYLQPS